MIKQIKDKFIQKVLSSETVSKVRNVFKKFYHKTSCCHPLVKAIKYAEYENNRSPGCLFLFRRAQHCQWHLCCEAATESTCGGGDLGLDHLERMPWEHRQLRLPLNIHLLSCHSCHDVTMLENCRALLVIKVDADFLSKFNSCLTRQF